MAKKNKLNEILIIFLILASFFYIPFWGLALTFPEFELGKFDYFPSGTNISANKELIILGQEHMIKINEQNVINYIKNHNGALIEEILSGNKYALFDFLKNLEVNRPSIDAPYGWDSWKYNIAAMLRIHPELLLETIVKYKQEINQQFIELFYPEPSLYGRPACLCLLKTRIEALEKLNQPELKGIKNEILLKLKERLALLSKAKVPESKFSVPGQGIEDEELRRQLKECDAFLPDDILKAKEKVENCPSPSNIHLLVEALRVETKRDERVWTRLLGICPTGSGWTFALARSISLIKEELLSGNEEAAEILLMCYRYGENSIGESVVELWLSTLLRTNPSLFLKVLKNNMHLFYTKTMNYPVDSVRYLPYIKEVCDYFLSQRLKALIRVRDKDLASIRDICIYQIKSKIDWINKSISYERLTK
ncbi:MAG: hypothetical protein ACP5SQ_08435 [Candidatus Saccharicenans sp.]